MRLVGRGRGVTASLLLFCIHARRVLFVVCTSFECDEILKNGRYLSLSPHESSVIPKTSDQCGWFAPYFAGWVHKLSTYETSLMYRIQELSSSGWTDHGARTTEIEAFGAAHALSQQEGQSARVLNPLDEMVCIMNRFGSTAIQSDHELVA
jgi:hypothetical protein